MTGQQMKSRSTTKNTLGAGALALSLGLGLAACSTTLPSTSPSTPAAEEPMSTPPSPPAGTSQPQDTGAATPETPDRYRDGEYTATGWYGSLPSHHDVTLTIADDTVTAVEITTPAENETSLGYQERFADALPTEIVGRNIDDLQIDRLAGSSGCSEGFMDALAQIKDEAAA
jgi:uncharacterized protein with FMN-binding domain